MQRKGSWAALYMTAIIGTLPTPVEPGDDANGIQTEAADDLLTEADEIITTEE